jgi:hypothetical protein
VGIVYGSQRVACATLFVRAHACVCTLLNIFSPKLVETFLGSQKRARHNLFLCARYARGCTHMCACVRSHILGRIRSKICDITLRGLHAFYVCTLCACVHCMHVRTHTLLDGFSPKLMEIYLGSQKRARHDCFLCARLRVHALRVGARTCAHVCVRTFLNVLAPTLVKTCLSVGYMHFVCAHYARTMRVRALHACARSHIFGRILSKIDGDIPWITETCTA